MTAAIAIQGNALGSLGARTLTANEKAQAESAIGWIVAAYERGVPQFRRFARIAKQRNDTPETRELVERVERYAAALQADYTKIMDARRKAREGLGALLTTAVVVGIVSAFGSLAYLLERRSAHASAERMLREQLNAVIQNPEVAKELSKVRPVTPARSRFELTTRGALVLGVIAIGALVLLKVKV